MAEKSYDIDAPEEPETSVLTVKPNDCNEVGGYDCDFVESPADELICKICHFPARDPQQTNECCGQTFCAMCLGKYMDSKILDNKQCPYCKTVPFTFVRDARTKRNVRDLKVFCPHKSLGCTWTGELRSLEQHLVKDIDVKKGCPFTELHCSNGCGVVMQRRLAKGHLKSECELREVKCEYCNSTGSYQWINSSHCEECPRYPVECPNHCEVGHVRREDISGHLEECPLAIVECPYAAVGSESVVRKKEKMEHIMGSVRQHMEYNKNAILANQNEFLKRLDVKEQEMENVKQDLQATKNKLIVKERELDDLKRDLRAIKDRLDAKEQAMMSINKDLQNTNDRLEKEFQSIKGDLQARIDTKEQAMMRNNKDLQDTNDRLEKEFQSIKRDLQARMDTKEQAMMNINKDLQDAKDKLKQSQDIQSQLKTAITEKAGRELDEVRKNAEENNRTLQKMMQQLKDKFEGNEQSLQHQLNANICDQLQSQFETLLNDNWSLWLSCLVITGNGVIPIVIKLAEFKKYKVNKCINCTRFYTKDEGYKMCLSIYPNSYAGHDDYVTATARLMKGDHDDHLTWPVKRNFNTSTS